MLLMALKYAFLSGHFWTKFSYLKYLCHKFKEINTSIGKSAVQWSEHQPQSCLALLCHTTICMERRIDTFTSL